MSKSVTTTNLKNPTPGDVLLEDFLLPLAMSQTALAKAIGVPPRRINEIVLGKRSVTAAGALLGTFRRVLARPTSGSRPDGEAAGNGCGTGEDHAKGGLDEFVDPIIRSQFSRYSSSHPVPQPISIPIFS